MFIKLCYYVLQIKTQIGEKYLHLQNINIREGVFPINYDSLFVKFVFGFVLLDVVLVSLLEVLRQHNITIFTNRMHTSLQR